MALTLALIGNPNSGKSTLFNALTGSNQTVGNWPGVTVEKKIGVVSHSNHLLVDLPGLYSLATFGLEEQVSRDYLVDNPDTVLINVIDGATIERSLFLTLQLIEMNRPLIVCINMSDELLAKGVHIDTQTLSTILDVPVIAVSARKRINIDELITQATQIPSKSLHFVQSLSYFSGATKKALALIKQQLQTIIPNSPLSLYYAILLLKGDDQLHKIPGMTSEIRATIHAIERQYQEAISPEDPITQIGLERYRYIERITKSAVRYAPRVKSALWQEKLDRVLTHPIWSIPIFIIVMTLIFNLSFGFLSTWMSDGLAVVIDEWIGGALGAWIESSGAAPWVYSFFIDALLAGVGGVMGFLPQIGILFLLLSVLEEVGYLARVAFVIDRFFRKLGVSGKAIIPLVLGFGCTVSAVTTTKAIEDVNERRMTILLTPFMSCSAKVPVYVLIAGLFFPTIAGWVVSGLYFLGILVAIGYGLVVHRLFLKKSNSLYLMEMPDFRSPHVPNVTYRAYQNMKSFVVRAGTLILMMTVLIWVLTSFSWNGQFDLNPETSVLAAVGRWIAPIFSPIGFGEWRAASTIIMGLAAKEVVVASIETLYTLQGFQSAFSIPSAISFVVFTALYIPCLSAIATMQKELASAKWLTISIVGQLLTAYLVAGLFYWGFTLWI